VILREIPDIPPRPLTPQNAAFRRWLYPRWGKEHAIVCARTRFAELGRVTQPLSIKAGWHGVAEHVVDNRSIRVDDDSWLVLNEDQTYSSTFRGDGSEGGCISALCLFVRRGVPAQIYGAMGVDLARAADDGENLPPRPLQFAENLRPHDLTITPLLLDMKTRVEDGEADETWLDERCHVLVARLIEAEHRLRARASHIRSVKASTREELLRRVGWAADYMLSNYPEALSLDDVAAAARLSKFHLIRLFQQVHGLTPHTFLQNKRARVARRLIESTDVDLNEVAAVVGFGTRWTMFRQLRRVYGASGLELRQGWPKQTAPGARSRDRGLRGGSGGRGSADNSDGDPAPEREALTE
jgi:AraC-like DNA-binding protein